MRPIRTPPTEAPVRSRKPMSASRYTSGASSRALVITLVLGAASAGLYFVLYLFSDTLSELAAATRAGEKIYALVPLAVAMVFSDLESSANASRRLSGTLTMPTFGSIVQNGKLAAWATARTSMR